LIEEKTLVESLDQARTEQRVENGDLELARLALDQRKSAMCRTMEEMCFQSRRCEDVIEKSIPLSQRHLLCPRIVGDDAFLLWHKFLRKTVLSWMIEEIHTKDFLHGFIGEMQQGGRGVSTIWNISRISEPVIALHHGGRTDPIRL
jgi:hypothetical protein